jgi:predicted site-specific integrase-resolvase
MNQEKFITPKEFRKMIGVTYRTVWNWMKSGKLKTIKTETNRYLISTSELERIKLIKPIEIPKINVIYARVSNTKQKDDLARQIERLSNYAIINGIKIDSIFSDIGSGMNFNRKHFSDLFNLILRHQINIVLIEHKDRLCRFAFELFEKLSFLLDFKLIITCQVPIESESFEQELTNDMISIIHHFSMKLYSSRRKKFKKLIAELKNDHN